MVSILLAIDHHYAIAAEQHTALTSANCGTTFQTVAPADALREFHFRACHRRRYEISALACAGEYDTIARISALGSVFRRRLPRPIKIIDQLETQCGD
jgi:hypothetical protein